MRHYSRDHRYLYAAIVCTVLGLLCLSLIGCAASRTGKALNVGVGVVGGWDNLETSKAEDRGARERNRLMGDSEVRRWALKSAGVGAVIGLTHLLENKGSPILAHVVRIVVIGIWSGAAIQNAGVQR